MWTFKGVRDMFREMEIDNNNNNIGSAISYFRDTYHISQSKLCKGLCSVSTLSRIEAGERDIDAFLLEIFLERLGKIPYQFELILTDFDYEAYQSRKEISKLIEDEAFDDK
jgi:transcriptional regulator with XRE-family HTH domain